MSLTSGQPAVIADLLAEHGAVRALINSIPQRAHQPESFGPQHLPSLVLASDVAELNGSEAVTTTMPIPPPIIDPESFVAIRDNWDESPSLKLDNGGSGYTIPRPCILIEYVSVSAPGYDSTPPGSESVWFLTNLWHEVDGGNSDNGPKNSRIFRPFQVAVNDAAPTTAFPKRCLGKSITIVRVTSYDDSSPTLTLDKLALRYVIYDNASAGGDYYIHDGSIGFIALATG